MILARELKDQKVVCYSPTRGLDVGATEFVHEQLMKCREEGCCIVEFLQIWKNTKNW